MASHFTNAMSQLHQQFLNLCTIVEEDLNDAIRAIETMDKRLATSVKARDKEIDSREIEIEEECLKVLALYRPVASDLRYIITLLKINSDLERIGDLSASIAKRVIYLSKHNLINANFHTPVMAEKAKEMLRKSIDAFVRKEPELAKEVCRMEADMDTLRKRRVKELSKLMSENPDQSEGISAYVSITRNLERIADHATNIAEDVIYMTDGCIIRHRRGDMEAISPSKIR